jgi:dihydropyrimidine dehydrogenase (NAD+) subunit PreA
VESAGADLIEINLGCPLDPGRKAPGTPVVPGEEFGMIVGVSPTLVEPVVKAVVEAVKIPVGPKLTPMAGFPGVLQVADACVRAGAKWLLTMHMVLGLPAPDIYDGGKPAGTLAKIHGANFISSFGGGQATRNWAFLYAAMVTNMFPSVDIFGGGGIVTGEHAAQLIMCGARATQLCASVLVLGRRQMRKINRFLSEYMDHCGYKTIEDFRGLAAKQIRGFEETILKMEEVKMVSATDESKCNGCGICADTLCPARYMEDGIAKVREEDCNLCGLCLIACPEGAVHFIPSKTSIRDRMKIQARKL